MNDRAYLDDVAKPDLQKMYQYWNKATHRE